MTNPDLNARCAFDIRVVTLNDWGLPRDTLLHAVYLDVLEAMAAEYFDGKAGPLVGGPVDARTLELRVDALDESAHAWSAWLDDCGSATKPEIDWRYIDDCDRGPVHAAITRRVHHHSQRLREATPLGRKGNVLIRADLPSPSAHLRLKLEQTRDALLVAHAQDEVAPPATAAAGWQDPS